MQDTRFCERCQQTVTVQIGKHVNTDGSEYFAWYCTTCWRLVKQKNGGHWIDKATLAKFVDLASIPTTTALSRTVCAHCGKPGAQLHHWAPHKLFPDDANQWPVDFLCPDCHRLWHRIVTPNLIPGLA